MGCVDVEAVWTALPLVVTSTVPLKDVPVPVVSTSAETEVEPSDPGSKLLAVTEKLPVVGSAGTAVEESMVAATFVAPQSDPATTR
jgi:hypothetical protein